MPALLLIILLALPLHAVVYVPPDDAATLFKRDLLPLDTDTMRELSSHLTALARRDIGEDPLHWRASAQLLAIAVRLDPANRSARDLGRRLATGDAQPPPPGTDFAVPISSTWRIVAWLLQPEAGPQGHLLGHQLLDALHIVDPRHPLAGRYQRDGEAERWRGVVAGLARFRGKDPAPVAPNPAPSPPPGPKPPPPPPPVVRPPVQLRQASLTTPLYLYDSTFRMRLRLARIAMVVVDSRDPGPFSFRLKPEVTSPLLDTARKHVRTSLQHTWPNLPLAHTAVLDTAQERYASRNSTAISGPAALLMHAALEGCELRNDLVLLGDLKSDGSLTRPRWSWDYVRALRIADGGRLLVPRELQPELRALIALESPEFFQKWEVFVADSVEDALSLARMEDGPGGLREASRLFADFQALAKDKPIGPLCVNEHVRKRFDEILAAAPSHFSASMLLLQGNLERPTRIEREVAARIVRSALDSLTALSKAPLANLSAQRVAAVYDATQADLQPFTKYFRKEDQDLAREATALANLTRSLAKALEDAGRNRQGTLVARNGVPIADLQTQLQTRLTAFLRKLVPFTGESIPPPPPPPRPAPAPAPPAPENSGKSP